MRVYCIESKREARPVKGRNDASPVYKCWRHGGGNLDRNSIKFRTIEEAAQFLRTNTGGGIRVAANGDRKGQKTAILHNNLVIEYDDGRIERL